MRPPRAWTISLRLLMFAVLYAVHPGVALIWAGWMIWRHRR